ncbi:hypothetical protein [Vibrio rotiferianus]|uniref:hypothetical protein n=1 Tax=Vibrio rotiferianus TaxID=190895 RepID=UPI0005EF3DB0|nr:hypothetical protein [Vibrio rotiferianus]
MIKCIARVLNEGEPDILSGLEKTPLTAVLEDEMGNKTSQSFFPPEGGWSIDSLEKKVETIEYPFIADIYLGKQQEKWIGSSEV